MTDYKIKLDVFEGPLDLLLHLIKEEELNIYDIPIAKITRQYFEYLEIMKELNLDVAGEFLVMAATLTCIKSRMLLPSRGAEEEEETGEDPREELVRRLIEYKKYKGAAVSLREMEERQSNTFTRSFPGEWDEDDSAYLQEVSVFQLLGAFRDILANYKGEKFYEVSLEEISVAEKMNEIMDRLASTPRLAFRDLFAAARSRMEIVGTLLALLELVKQSLARVYQEKEFGEIWVQNVETEEDADKPAGEEGGDSPEEPAKGTEGQ